MNRSILIVICDFLLVSLLVFSTPDISKVTNPGDEQNQLQIVTNRPDARQDLAGVMRLALEDERKGHEQLLNQLTQTRQSLEQQQALLSEREKQARTFQQQLDAKSEQAQRLAQEKAGLQQQYASAQTNLQALNQQLQTTKSDALMSRERAAVIEAGLRDQAEQAAALEHRLGELSRSNEMILSEKQQLATQLQVTEAEKRAATQQLTQMKDEVQVERQEKVRLAEHADKLADGVKILASKSGELAEGVKTLSTQSTALTQEIRENRPLAANTIFGEFSTNRVQAGFFGVRSGIFGIDMNRRRDTETILITNGTNTFAVCHVADTPLVFSTPGAEWVSLTGSLSRGRALISIPSVSFSRSDPRIVLIPLTAAQAQQLGSRAYRISPDPLKFQDAVIVGAREGYYGESKFQLDLSTPHYLKMDHNFLKGLFGKFNPSRGDLVFSKTGELLGIMVNGSYCCVLQDFGAAGTIQCGEDIRAQHTEWLLGSMYMQVGSLPIKLQ